MSVFKTTFSRALKVAVTPNCDIPSPNVIVSGTTSDVSSNSLVDNSVSFEELNVKAGDIVYNTDTYEGATVVGIINPTNILLNADIFLSSEANYTIYQASSQTGIGNQGCFLYIEDADTTYQVITIGGDEVEFKTPVVGAVLPVQVIKVISGGDCVALW